MHKTAAQIANAVIFKIAAPLDAIDMPVQATGVSMRPNAQAPTAPRRHMVNWNAPGAQTAANRPSQALIDRWNRQYLAKHPGAKMPAARPAATAPAVASRQPTALPHGVYGAPEGGVRQPAAPAAKAAPAPASRPAAAAGGGGRSIMLPPPTPKTPTKYGPAHDPSWYRNALRPYESSYQAPSSGYNPADYAGLPTPETSPGIQRAIDEKQKVEEMAARRRDARRGTLSRAF